MYASHMYSKATCNFNVYPSTYSDVILVNITLYLQFDDKHVLMSDAHKKPIEGLSCGRQLQLLQKSKGGHWNGCARGSSV